MACETKHRDIGGHRWTVTQMSATEALDLQTRLAPMAVGAVAPVMAALGRVLQGRELSEGQEAEVMKQAVSALTKTLAPEEMARIIRELCEQASKDGASVVFDQEFSGGKGIMLMYRVAWFVLEANFADFIEELLPARDLDRAKKLYEKMMAGGDGSTGGSGDRSSPGLPSAA